MHHPRRGTWVLRAGVFVVVLAVVGTGCGDDGESGGGASGGGVERCVNMIVSSLNRLDTSGIDITDGLDDAEIQLGRDRLDRIEADNPDAFDEDGTCAEVLEDLSDEDAEALAARVDPVVAALLGAAAGEEFEEIGDSIPDSAPATVPATVVTEPGY